MEMSGLSWGYGGVKTYRDHNGGVQILMQVGEAPTQEELQLAWAREEYTDDRIDVWAFECLVEKILRGEWVMPMGGLPPPDTSRPETR